MDMFLCACGAPPGEESAGTAPQTLPPGEPRSGERSAKQAHGIIQVPLPPPAASQSGKEVFVMITPSSVLLPPGGQRILVMMAHPDDAEFICGGTVARLVQEGREVHYLLVTRGDKGNYDPDMTAERLMVIREEEQRRAAAVLGVQSVTFLEGYRDGEVEVSLTLRKALALEVRKIRPDIVFSFDPWKMYEHHPDHRATATCSLDALVAARSPMYFPEQLRDGITPHRVRQVYFFSTDRPNHWVDISEVIDKKIEALRCHVTQTKNMELDAYVRRHATIAGIEQHYELAESFHHYVPG